VPFGKARVAAKGEDLTMVGVSNMVLECLRAAELLNETGVKAEVIDPISLVPLDIDTIAKSAKRTKHLMVIDNAWTSGGASAEIVAGVLEAAGPGAGIAVKRMGFAPTTCPTTPALEDLFYPNPVTIAEAAHRMVRPKDKPWRPDPEHAKLAYQAQFRGPF
jgi:pyruvate dehydrogenase E1 component beta subunit